MCKRNVVASKQKKKKKKRKAQKKERNPRLRCEDYTIILVRSESETLLKTKRGQILGELKPKATNFF